MNVLITGIRSFWSEDLIEHAVKASGFKIKKVVSGLGAGVEMGSLWWARAHNVRTVGFDIQPYIHERDPEVARLVDMVNYTDAVIYITDGKTKMSEKPVKLAKQKGIPIFVFKFKKEDWHGRKRATFPKQKAAATTRAAKGV